MKARPGPKHDFDFEDRGNSPSIFNSKDQQLKMFLKLNRNFDQRARSNARPKYEKDLNLKKTAERDELRHQMKLLENELFRC
mmetsp:Transcript_30916/g.35311  ORF Transcript_30916/g.35311 Transcript_30916/m.35311 type:complete len:82 (-) Transcript_30916:28-273(-)